MTYDIVPITPEHIPSFHEALDAIIRESRMYTFLEAPPLNEVTEFITGVLRSNDVQFVAVSHGKVIGWCDVLRKVRPAMRHSGVLGIGVLSAYRRQGIAKTLLERSVAAAWQRGLTRVELAVRTDNEPAKCLYEKVGFTIEGTLRKHMLIDGVYRDSHLMSVLYE